MTARKVLGMLLVLWALSPRWGEAADQLILGRRIVLRGGGLRANVIGVEEASSNSVVGDPTIAGATLRIFANGATSTSQTISLPATQWAANFQNGYGFFGRGLAGPVKFVRIRRNFLGKFFIKAQLTGSLGPITVVPPNPGDDGGMVLTINGGDRYCVTLGGAAGGDETADSAALWRVVQATTEVPCPPGSPSGAFLETSPDVLN